MSKLLTRGMAGPEVQALAQALKRELGDDAAPFAVLDAAEPSFDDSFEAAVRRWQAGVGIIADGVVGPRCQVLLNLVPPQGGKMALPLTVGHVSQLFPATKPANIARYLPYVEAALGVFELTDRAMILGALGTIRAETEGFVPIAEFPSRFNTAPGGPPFGLYDGKLGNGPGDGARFRGRGFVQLTGRDNYAHYSDVIGHDLLANPDLANAPEAAALLLAAYLSTHAEKLRAAVQEGRLKDARKVVNGGMHGLDRFASVFELAEQAWEGVLTGVAVGAGAGAGEGGTVASRRPAHAGHKVSRTKKDAPDLRDRAYMPPAVCLPDEFPPQEDIARFLPAYTGARLILDQGREGACTGFGLACVVNYLRWVKARNPPAMVSVSPRMLYNLARRYDEYDGEDYEGSSCRGAIKGWFNNGVCLEDDWPYEPDKSNPARYGFATRATQNTLGVYYRIETKSVTDLQAAIHQHGAIFVSAFTHDGWDAVPEVEHAPGGHADVPVIDFAGRPSRERGHAFALVGFNRTGFLVQNSWGDRFGAGGFAVLTYLDWLANGMDAWVVSLGVPGVVAGRLASTAFDGAGRAATGADRSKWWDQGLAYQHSVVFGNDGRIARYLTEDEPPRRLQQQVFALPDRWFRERPADEPKRLVLYAHGGLNSEDDAIKRASAMGRYFIGNGCYPIFLVWKTGLMESLRDVFEDARRKLPAAAGIGEWVSEKTDLLLEKTIGRPFARPLWSEMKENAQLAFTPRHGGELLLEGIQALLSTWGDRFELHLVGHSAGSIFLGHLLKAARKRVPPETLKTVNLYAPACTVAFANQHYAADKDVMERLYLDVLSDKTERDDNVIQLYRKSLLYFVSNACEPDLRTPILGMDAINNEAYSNWDGTSDTGEALRNWREAAAAAGLRNRTSLVNDRVMVAVSPGGEHVMEAASHGVFDNDIEVVSRTLARITGRELPMAVEDLRGY